MKFRVRQRCELLYPHLGIDVNDLEVNELIEYLEFLIEDLMDRPDVIPELIVIKKPRKR